MRLSSATFPDTDVSGYRTCSVPLSRFKNLSEEMFEIHIPYKELEQSVSGTLPVTLTKKPDWVHGVTLTPDKIEFILEHIE